jgi:hypothetical protein
MGSVDFLNNMRIGETIRVELLSADDEGKVHLLVYGERLPEEAPVFELRLDTRAEVDGFEEVVICACREYRAARDRRAQQP